MVAAVAIHKQESKFNPAHVQQRNGDNGMFFLKSAKTLAGVRPASGAVPLKSRQPLKNQRTAAGRRRDCGCGRTHARFCKPALNKPAQQSLPRCVPHTNVTVRPLDSFGFCGFGFRNSGGTERIGFAQVQSREVAGGLFFGVTGAGFHLLEDRHAGLQISGDLLQLFTLLKLNLQ